MADFRFWKQPQLLKRSLQILKWGGGVVAVGVTGASIVGIVWWLPQKQVEPLKARIESLEAQKPKTFEDFERLAQQEKARLDAETAIRTPLIQLAGGILGSGAALLLAWVAYKNYKEAKRKNIVEQEKIVAERFSKAVEQLGHDDTHVRLGGIFALEQIAKDAEEKYYWQVMETITAYVRVESRRPIPRAKSPMATSATLNREERIYSMIEIQAAMTVLGRRKHSYQNGEAERLNLCNANLQDVRLAPKAKFQGVDFQGANLSNAKLIDVNLQRAKFNESTLQGAYLWHSDLQSADFCHANVCKTQFRNSNLNNANFALRFGEDSIDDSNFNARNLTADQIRASKSWDNAVFSAVVEKELQE